MNWIFNEIFYRPILNALVFIYEYAAFNDFGIALILLTVLVRIILAPIFHRSARDQAIINKLVPKIKEIQSKHKNKREQQAKALMELYREHKVSPFSGIILLIVQLPVLVALYYVVWNGFSEAHIPMLYSFVPNPGVINYLFLGVIDLQAQNVPLVILASAASYLQMKLAMSKHPLPLQGEQQNPMLSAMRKTVFIIPIMTAVFIVGLPSAIALYLLTSFVFSAIQQVIINKQINNNGTTKK